MYLGYPHMKVNRAQNPFQNFARLLKKIDTHISPEQAHKLRTTARLMQTTAHPDDEDSGFLVYESRGRGAEVMLFTLTRGDGGQNKTGSNFFDELGVLRTLDMFRELLAVAWPFGDIRLRTYWFYLRGLSVER